MALVRQSHPAVLVDATALLVHVESLIRLHQLWFLVLVVKVTHHVVGVKVVLLQVEWCWDLTTLIQVFLGKHLLEVLVLKNGARAWVTQVASLRDSVSVLVFHYSVCVLWHNNVSCLVSVDVTKDVVLVESAQVCSWWHVDWSVAALSEVVHKGVGHLNSLVHTRQLWGESLLSALLLSLCLSLVLLLLLSLGVLLLDLHL